MISKVYLRANLLLRDSFSLADAVYQSGFRPTFILALWRGGAPIALPVQEYFAYRGVPTDHILIRTSSYEGIDNQSRTVRIFGLNYLIKHLSAEDKVLIVDDVFDTGRTIDSLIDTMAAGLKLNMPDEIRVAVPYYKPSRNETTRIPDYYLHESEEWLVYPHSIEGLAKEEIKANKPKIYEILSDHL